jgi:hypothetical protein
MLKSGVTLVTSTCCMFKVVCVCVCESDTYKGTSPIETLRFGPSFAEWHLTLT